VSAGGAVGGTAVGTAVGGGATVASGAEVGVAGVAQPDTTAITTSNVPYITIPVFGFFFICLLAANNRCFAPTSYKCNIRLLLSS
jgi:hypothetical protein